MAKKGAKKPRTKGPALSGDGKTPQAYEHTEEKLLLRPDIGLQPQFKAKKPPKTYRYDPSLDPTWRAVLRDFEAAVREHYGARLDRVLLYGSRARGDAEWDSDFDVLVVLDRCDDFWAEMDRISGAAADIMVKHGIVLSAMPASIRELETSDKSIFRSIRREGVRV